MKTLSKLLDIMRALRNPQSGCPWDLEQTFRSIVPHTIEEAYEVADCIERDAMAELPGELGDLLFQVVFYAQLADEQKLFDFDDVVAAISAKIIRRHPHVFASAKIESAAEQSDNWEAQKARERNSASDAGWASELAGVPLGLPALSRAQKIQKRAARVGFDWPHIAGVKAKVREEITELESAARDEDQTHIEEEMGDLLFACVNWARHLDVDPETALRAATIKFERRFNFIEENIARAGGSVAATSLAHLDMLWESAKSAEKQRK